jgi:hypothetical protein
MVGASRLCSSIISMLTLSQNLLRNPQAQISRRGLRV